MPTKLWSNATGYGVQFEAARLEFEQPPKYDDKALEVFDDDDDSPIPMRVDDDDNAFEEPDDSEVYDYLEQYI